MGNLLHILSVITINIWVIGFFAYSAEGTIHILLAIALVSFLLKVVFENKIVE